MDLHPYDGKERRFRHTDPDPSEGLRIVARVLKLAEPPALEGALFDLSFYSGGIGVVDKLAITLRLDDAALRAVLLSLRAKNPNEATADDGWKEDFLWLIADADGRNPKPAEEEAASFINENRSDFQPRCQPSDPIWFVPDSGVNSWIALWQSGAALNYLAYDQG